MPNFKFAPSFKLTLLALIVITCLVYLGLWQLQRAHAKKSIAAQLQAQSSIAPVKLSSLTNPSLHHDRFLPVIVEGVFMNQFTFLLDNQTMNGKAGYRVLTPLHSPHLDNWVLIDRGWIAAGPDRSKLPNIQAIFGLQKVIGQIDTIPTGIILSKDKIDTPPKWPLVIQQIDYHLISVLAHHPVYKFLMRMQEHDVHAFVFPPVKSSSEHRKHIAYAIQWFTFAGLVLIYYIVVSTTKRKTK